MCKKFHHCQTAVTCDKHACAGTAPLLEFWPKTGAIFWPPIRLSFCRNCNQIRVSVPKMGPPGGPLFGTGRQQAQARKSTRSGGRVFGEGSGTFCSRACRSKRSPGAKRPFRRLFRWRKRCTHLVLWPSCVSKPICAILFFPMHLRQVSQNQCCCGCSPFQVVLMLDPTSQIVFFVQSVCSCQQTLSHASGPF